MDELDAPPRYLHETAPSRVKCAAVHTIRKDLAKMTLSNKVACALIYGAAAVFFMAIGAAAALSESGLVTVV